ncbi:MAG: PD-(D/E)XK nuclease family protein [Pyrobaculum sp.]|jgi:hypothetical protein
MDSDEIGMLNVEVLYDIVGDLADCRNRLKEGLRASSHLVKAASVARAVGRCPFEARLIEIMGASDLAASTSVFPGKGQSVHQVLAVAVPRLFVDFIITREFDKALGAVESYVSNAYDELREARVPPLEEEARTTRGDAVIRSAVEMARVFVQFMRQLDAKQILDVSEARVRAELQLFDYKMHVRGIPDLVVEEPAKRRAVVVEWKTSLGMEGGATPSPDEIAQGYVYSIMVAHRLGFKDGAEAVEKCAVFPVVIRDRGRKNPYSISRCFNANSTRLSEEKILKEIKLAATHLILSMLNLKKVDSSWDREKEKALCGSGGKVVFRYVPEALRNKGYTLNPHVNTNYPCGSCRLREACKFYLFSKQNPDEVHQLAWRTRYRVYGVRENALLPFYSIAKMSWVRGFIRLEGGARADFFERIEVDREKLKADLIRGVREEEDRRGVPLTVREGKPVTIFLGDSEEIIYSTSFSGNVDKVLREGDELRVVVSFEGKFTKLSYFLLRDLLSREEKLSRGVVAVESNVDLTHIELMAIDAFQRAVKKLAEEEGWNMEEAKRVAFEAGYKVKRRLYRLFGPVA